MGSDAASGYAARTDPARTQFRLGAKSRCRILADTGSFEQLRGYVQGVVGRFAKDRRVVAWDVFNEPDNTNRPAYLAYEPLDKEAHSFILIRKAFVWAREMNPSQPLTAAPWRGDWIDPTRVKPFTAYMLDSSDVITFHSYDDSANVERLVTALELYGRPIICSEYMARPRAAPPEDPADFRSTACRRVQLGVRRGQDTDDLSVDSWDREYTAEPAVWFHDIFRSDGTPYDAAEGRVHSRGHGNRRATVIITPIRFATTLRQLRTTLLPAPRWMLPALR